MKIAVVGAGICGLNVSRFLSKRGHQVDLFEQFETFHRLGSSHGESRIVRRAYPDAFYTACMTEAYGLWSDLELEAGVELVDECGLLYFGESRSPGMMCVVDALSEVGVPHHVLAGDQAGTVFPALRLSATEVGVFTPEAGWVRADLAMQASLALAERHGTTLHRARVDPHDLSPQYDAVVVCAGPWVRRFLDLPVTVTLQTYAYLQTHAEGPVWIEDGDVMLYGFPSSRAGTKVGVHRPGPTVDPDSSDRSPSEDDIALIADFGRRRLGTDVAVEGATGCLYTWAPNEDYLLGQVEPNIFYASACSGHGFKAGPWIGKLLADFVEGKDSPDNWPRFAAPK